MTGKLKIKICGMRDPENIRELAERVKPDLMGLIFFSGSKRYVTEPIPDTPGIERVGVFVNATENEIIEKIKTYHLDYIQLHGDESAEQIQSLSEENIKVIKVIRVESTINFETLLPYIPFVKYFLFDTAGKNYGGNGMKFQWDILKDYPYDTPYLIGGGINPENIEDLIGMKLSGFAGIDLNSGFEKSPALKDIELLENIFDNNEISGRR